jgi:hypothetical protein
MNPNPYYELYRRSRYKSSLVNMMEILTSFTPIA